jgi:hypothetical protein
MKKTQAFAIVAAVLVLVAGSLIFFQQASSSPDCEGQGPCMLYFYTDW